MKQNSTVKKREYYADKLADFIEARKELVWYVKNPRNLDDDAIVEAVLNYGDWNDVQEMIEIMGIENAAAAFRRTSKPDKFRRTNYYPEVTNYFELYFNKYA